VTSSDEPIATAARAGPGEGASVDGGGSVPVAAGGSTGKGKSGKPGGSFWRELPVLVIVALGLALVIKAFLVQAFFIPSGSMEKTLHGCPGCSGDRVLVNKLTYRFRDVHRGEIVVFNGVDSWTPEVAVTTPTNPLQRVLRDAGAAFGVAPPGEEDYIKRVIGIPGDSVACCDSKGHVTVNRVALTEPYVYQDDHRPFGPAKVPAGRLWVMGDHRGFSADSRLHTGDPGGGTISERHVIGRAFVIVWPPSRIGILPVPKTFSAPALQHAASSAVPAALGLAGTVPVVLVCRRRRTRAMSAVR